MQQNRDFKGIWIDKSIWFDKRLNALEKVIFAEIDSLDTEENGCFASNEYLADFCQCSTTKVSLAISKLIDFGYIYVYSFDGRHRVLKSRLSKNERQTFKNCKADIEDFNANNINNNKDINKKDNKYIAEQVLFYLNKKANKRFKAIPTNLKFILGRLKDYSEDDLKAVIDKKVAEWKGTEMETYLRPETLFNATKFESYVNAPLNKPNKVGYDNSQHFECERQYEKSDYDYLMDNIDDIDF